MRRPTLLTCFIRYEIDPFKVDAFDQYARNWGEAIPRCGADLIGYYAPKEGSNTIAYGVYNIESLAAIVRTTEGAGAIPCGRDQIGNRQTGSSDLRLDRGNVVARDSW